MCVCVRVRACVCARAKGWLICAECVACACMDVWQNGSLMQRS